MRLAALDGRRVAVWGFGREGRCVLEVLARRLPQLKPVLLCRESEREAAQAAFPGLAVHGGEVDTADLTGFDVVIKSPGISIYLPQIEAARAAGTTFTSATAIWFAECPQARVIAVTGTKGKSTTSAMLAHLARALGVRTALAGNIGLPVLELLDRADEPELWVLELSSFQCRDARDVELGVVTSLYDEHLDWHGTRERYIEDKLALGAAARTLLVNATQPDLMRRTASHPRRLTFGDDAGWHVGDDALYRDGEAVLPLHALPVPGPHNALNACAALAALEAMGFDARVAAPALRDFRPLPHRLQPLGERDGRRWINDSISTTPEATMAALRSVGTADTTVIVGGHDRGLDWDVFARFALEWPPARVLVQGANAERIEAALREAGATAGVERCSDLAAAVARASELTAVGGTVLLSPGAPSFDQFRDYTERGRRFAEWAGFADEAVGIDGLGIA